MKRGWGALAVAVLLGVLEAFLVHDAVRAPGIVGRGYPILAETLAAAGIGALGALVLRWAPRRAAVGTLLGLAVLLHLSALVAKAPLSNDLYRYAWDGRVQAAGIDPYRYPPDAAALVRLRDPGWLWPAGRHTLINRPAYRTIYPPAAQGWFWLLHVAGVARLHDRGYELVGLGCDLAVLAAVLALLRRGGRDPRLAAWYALSPYPVLEAVADGHVDVLASLLVLGALAFATRRRTVRACALVAVAFLVKLYPGALLAVAARPARRGWRDPVLGGAAFLGVAGLGYAPHVAAVGVKVLGYLPRYLAEEHYTTGTRYVLLDLIGLRGAAATDVVLLVLLATALWAFLGRAEPFLAATVLLGVLLLLLSPVQTWYGLPLAAVAVVAGRPEWLAVCLAGYPLYVTTILNGAAVRAGRDGYLAAAVIVLVATLLRAGAQLSPRSGSRANARTPSRKGTAAA